MFLAGVEFHVLHCVLVCFLVKFDLLFAFSVLSCRILDCASLFIYVHEHGRLCFPMLTVETAVFDCICWLSSSRDRKGQSCLIRSNTVWNRWKSPLSEGTIHKGEPEPRNGNVNTVYFINQARGKHVIANGYLYLSILRKDFRITPYIYYACRIIHYVCALLF